MSTISKTGWYARTGDPSFAHSYNGLGDRVTTATAPAGGGNPDTRTFVTAPDGRVIGEYGANANDVRAEFIWLSPEVGDSTSFGGDDGIGGYICRSQWSQEPRLLTSTGPCTRLLWSGFTVAKGKKLHAVSLFTSWKIRHRSLQTVTANTRAETLP